MAKSESDFRKRKISFYMVRAEGKKENLAKEKKREKKAIRLWAYQRGT